jgi:hypothetical protein
VFIKQISQDGLSICRSQKSKTEDKAQDNSKLISSIDSYSILEDELVKNQSHS